MLKPLIRTLDGWRFELPLALVLGASVAFAMIAMPYSLFGGVPAIQAHGVDRPIEWAFAAFVAMVAGVVGYRAMKHPWGGRPAAAAVVPEEAEEVPPIDVSLRLRRSDAHPDFPPRQPIHASRDLGEPFMDIVGFEGEGAPVPPPVVVTPEPVEEPVAAAEPEEAAEAEWAPVVDETPVVAEDNIREEEAEPVAVEIAEPEAALPGEIVPPAPIAPAPLTLVEDSEDHSSIAAFTPDAENDPAPQPERARRESLAEMMERLSAGLERRAGKPVAPPPADMLAEVLARPRDATPELRDALNELNRLAGRR